MRSTLAVLSLGVGLAMSMACSNPRITVIEVASTLEAAHSEEKSRFFEIVSGFARDRGFDGTVDRLNRENPCARPISYRDVDGVHFSVECGGTVPRCLVHVPLLDPFGLRQKKEYQGIVSTLAKQLKSEFGDRVVVRLVDHSELAG